MDLITVKHAIKTYQTGEDSFNALNDVSFSIKKGEFVAIMGTSGSGKSTCMNMLGTLDKPTSGEYYLDGEDMLHLDNNRLAMVRCEKIGFIFQGFNLISRTSALDNVCLPMIYKGIPESERIERAKWALKIVGLENREDHMPNQMSGGQQQRVAIARAIVNDAPLMFVAVIGTVNGVNFTDGLDGLKDPATTGSDIDSANFYTKTKAALAYYEGTVKSDYLYYVGEKSLKQVYDNDEKKQDDKANFIELVAASALFDFLKRGKPDNQQYLSRAIESDLESLDLVSLGNGYKDIVKSVADYMLLRNLVNTQAKI